MRSCAKKLIRATLRRLGYEVSGPISESGDGNALQGHDLLGGVGV